MQGPPRSSVCPAPSADEIPGLAHWDRYSLTRVCYGVVMKKKSFDKHHRKAFQWAFAHRVSPHCTTDEQDHAEPGSRLGAAPAYFIQTSQQANQLGAVIIPILYTGKLRIRKRVFPRPRNQDAVDCLCLLPAAYKDGPYNIGVLRRILLMLNQALKAQIPQWSLVASTEGSSSSSG